MFQFMSVVELRFGSLVFVIINGSESVKKRYRVEAKEVLHVCKVLGIQRGSELNKSS